MGETSQTFEQSITRLDAIVKQMEQGNVPLEQALALFKEGIELVQKCSGMLDSAELQVVRLMKSADGSPAETEFVRDE